MIIYEYVGRSAARCALRKSKFLENVAKSKIAEWIFWVKRALRWKILRLSSVKIALMAIIVVRLPLFFIRQDLVEKHRTSYASCTWTNFFSFSSASLLPLFMSGWYFLASYLISCYNTSKYAFLMSPVEAVFSTPRTLYGSNLDLKRSLEVWNALPKYVPLQANRLKNMPLSRCPCHGKI